MVIKNKLKHIACLILCILFPFMYSHAEAIKGIVKDSDGTPVSGVLVNVLDEFTQQETSPNGKYEIEAAVGKTLYFYKDGFEPVQIKVEVDQTEIDLTLTPLPDLKITQLAYGSRPLDLLTAAVSTINADDLAKSPVATLDNAIQGRTNGLTVLKRTGDEPGWDATSIYVRGIGTFGSGRSPLILVDNVERDFTQLDPEEVESFTVLKDAAATAIHGMRAANGVILITTKKGFIGKPEINLSTRFGFQTPEQLPNYLGSFDHVNLKNIALANDGIPATEDPERYSNPDDKYRYANTDWYKEMIRTSAPIQNHKITLRGGTDIAQYYFLLGITQQDGIFNFAEENRGYSTNSKYNRYNIRSNVNVNVNENFKIGLNLSARMENRHVPNSSSSSIFTAISSISPTMPIKNRDGSIAGNSTYKNNPYGLIAKTGYEDQFFRYLQGTITASHKLNFLLDGLSVNGMFAFDSYKMHRRGKVQKFATFQEINNGQYIKYGEDTETDLNFTSGGEAFYLQSTFQGGFNYDKSFGDHTIAADLIFNGSNLKLTGNNADSNQLGVGGRFTYAYDKRYVAEVNVGYNGSEDFIHSERFGIFPALSAAWIASNEDFLNENSTITYLKLRGSYGKVGNSNSGLGRFLFQPTYSMGGGYVFGTGFSGTDGAYEGRIPNKNVLWEESLNGNVGLDIEFLNQITLNIDLFRNDRNRIITERANAIPGIFGQYLPYENIGSVLNKGFELGLMYKNNINRFNYFVQGNMSFARNEITHMNELAGMEDWEYRTGNSVTQGWALEAIGIFQEGDQISDYPKSEYKKELKPGDVIYKDQNRDSKINAEDMIPYGYPEIPEINYGLNLGFNYGLVDFSMLLYGVANRTVFVTNNVFWGFQKDSRATSVAYDSWREDNTNTKYPKLTTGEDLHNYNPNSTLWAHNGNFLRLQNLEIGVQLPKSILAKVNIRSVRIFANGSNLFSLDHLSKYNLSAEVPNAGVTMYPRMRTYSFGATIKF